MTRVCCATAGCHDWSAAGPAVRGRAAAPRPGWAGLPRHRRHHPGHLRVCRAGRWARLWRRQRAQCAARDAVHPRSRPGDLRCPAAPRHHCISARGGQAGRRRPRDRTPGRSHWPVGGARTRCRGRRKHRPGLPVPGNRSGRPPRSPRGSQRSPRCVELARLIGIVARGGASKGFPGGVGEDSFGVGEARDQGVGLRRGGMPEGVDGGPNELFGGSEP